MFDRHSKLTGDIIHYYSGDPAFDKERRRTDVAPPPDAPEDWQPPLVFDLQRWIETNDENCLPRLPNAVPVKFVCKRLSPDERAFIEDLEQSKGSNTAFLWLVRVSLQRIEPKPQDTPEFTRVTRQGFSLLGDDWTTLIRNHDDGHLYFELAARLLKELKPSSRS